MSDESLRRILRAQAWARAKGELEAILVTFVGEKDAFEAMDALVKAFVNNVEDNGLAE